MNQKDRTHFHRSCPFQTSNSIFVEICRFFLWPKLYPCTHFLMIRSISPIFFITSLAMFNWHRVRTGYAPDIPSGNTRFPEGNHPGTGSQLHSQGEHAERQRPDLVCCQGISGLGKKASGKGREQLHAAASLFVLPGVLRHIISAEPDGVAEIMAHKTGHHRIQINDGQSPVGVPVEKDIVDLRIVVGHPDGETGRPSASGPFHRPGC